MSVLEAAPDPAVAERPKRPRGQRGRVVELGGAAFGALCLVVLGFVASGTSAPFGMVMCWALTFFVLYGLVTWRLHGVLYMKDALATVAIWSGALVALIPLVALIFMVVYKGAPVVLARFPHFVYADMSQAGGSEPVTAVGVGASIVGSVEQVGIASLISVPVAYLTAAYLVESRSFLSRTVRGVIEAMSGTPSIIAGIFVYFLWVLPHGTAGKSGLAAGMALSVMMLPVVTRSAAEVIAVVPGSLREAALGLGAPQWRVMLRVVLPTARVGLVTAAILGVARTTGETAELLFTAGGSSHYNWDPLSGWQDSLPLRIFELIFQPSVNAIREAWGASFVLLILIFLLFAMARLVGSAGGGRRRSVFRRRSVPVLGDA